MTGIAELHAPALEVTGRVVSRVAGALASPRPVPPDASAQAHFLALLGRAG